MKPSTHALVDIGANLGNKAFRDDLPAVLQRAAAAGVHDVVVTGTSLGASTEALALARTGDAPVRLWATAGIHPHHAKTWRPRATQSLRELCQAPQVRAVGECGLDFDRNFSPREDQLACFEAQLELAAELGLPVFLHERAAHEDFYAIMQRWRPRLRAAVVHCFTGDERALLRYLELDLHIGFTGWLTDTRRGQHLVPLARRIPASRLMLETDAPYILPKNVRPTRDRRNEPALLPHVLAAVALARGEPEAEVAAASTRTARAFFGISAPRPPLDAGVRGR